ncbi:putative dimethylaniline monooxygenase [Zalerion maritima]|uniref:Dimethylaniline monooxygenase n=1 Tax=Zalerion maritima TaxID=339359 RepID=A0AAD5RT63_9PEZI|nr:putative dimethylaniline monooxygenase [Zalerion maritima]
MMASENEPPAPHFAKRKIAIIGGGPTGLAALKECLAEGHTAVAFEGRPEIGGQWAYQPIPPSNPSPSSSPNASSKFPLYPDVWSSMYDSAELNSCRDTTSFGDFPIDPARYEQYFGHAKMLQYLKEYAEHFDLMPCIRLSTCVVEVEFEAAEGDATSKAGGPTAVVRTQKVGSSTTSSDVEEEKFDAVLVCTGHLTKPVTPDFEGRDKYEGGLGHSHYYRSPETYKGKKTVLIGQGSSAIDIATELTVHAKEVHMVTRRGGWVIPKWVLGKPAEAWDNRVTQLWIPLGLSQWLQTQLLNLVMGTHPPLLKPDHKILEQNASCQQTFVPLVKEGKIKIHRTTIEELSENGIGLADKSKIDDVDAIICCTGYSSRELPFQIKHADKRQNSNKVPHDLYKMIVPVTNNTAPSVYYLGFIDLFGPHLPTAEAQARWVAAALSGRINLPDEATQKAEIEHHKKLRQERFVGSERHDLAAYPVEYIDDLMTPLGAVPTTWACLKKGVWNAVFVGVTAAAQWRLFGHGACEQLAKASVKRVVAEKKEMSLEEKAGLKAQREEILRARKVTK